MFGACEWAGTAASPDRGVLESRCQLEHLFRSCPQYASWEEQQKDFRRARSVWERCLDVDHRSIPTWLKYAEMEMRHRFVNHARNVWDRAVTILPRVDQLW